ncbi:hypothetical protein JCM8547_005147 [Rhodosporidiobolus lusitaniae]
MPSIDRTGISQLTALLDEVNTTVDRVLKTDSVALPSHDSLDSAILPPAPSVLEAISVVKELLALLQGISAVFERSLGYHVSSSLRVAVEAHVAETLREAKKEQGKEGLHAAEIAKSSNIDPAKLARILRLLGAHHIFVETQPDCFGLNRNARVLDTGKSVEELKSSKDWYTGTNGFAALIAFRTSEPLLASSSLSSTLLHPSRSISHSTSASSTALVRALHATGQSTAKTAWEFFTSDEEAGRRFGAAMRGLSSFGQGGEGERGFPFSSLPNGALVVDVGSGIGSVSLSLIKSFPHLKIVLQDREEVMEQAKAVWGDEASNAVKEGRVQFMPHDFFQPQPVKSADVYLLRAIIHDWADDYALRILRQLHRSASPSSTLLLIELPLSHLSSSGGRVPSIPGITPYLLDLHMLTSINGQERTKELVERLAGRAGWRLRKVWKTGEVKEGKQEGEEGEREDGAWRMYEFETSKAKEEV